MAIIQDPGVLRDIALQPHSTAKKLIDLPQEILDQIWKDVAAGTNLTYVLPERKTRIANRRVPSMLLLCRSQQKTTNDLLLRHATVHIHNSSSMSELVCCCRSLAKITNLSIVADIKPSWRCEKYPFVLVNDLFIQTTELRTLKIHLSISVSHPRCKA